MKRLALSFASLLLAQTAFAFPVTVDSCGTPLTFDAAPKRAVIQDMNMAEMAFALGLQPSIGGLTGITGWYKVGPEFKAKQGAIPELAPKYPALENLVAVEPDFFFAGWYYGMKPGGEVTPDTLAPHGVKTLVLTESCVHLDNNRPVASMDLLYGDIEKLGRISASKPRRKNSFQAGKRNSPISRQRSATASGRGCFSTTPAKTNPSHQASSRSPAP